MLDHPIFLKSLQIIKAELGETGLAPIQQQVLERVIHTSGDFELKNLLIFSNNACESGLIALKNGANILTDTEMCAAAVRPMAMRTIQSSVFSALEWAPSEDLVDNTRTAYGMTQAWKELSVVYEHNAPIVLVGSSPTALKSLLALVKQGSNSPSLIIAMPVGFVGVQESKQLLKESNLPYISLNGTKGGAAISASVINALLRACILE